MGGNLTAAIACTPGRGWSRQRRCHAVPSAPPCRTLPRTHRTSHTHAATFRCTPILRGCCPAPTLRAGLRCAPYAPIAAVFFSRASPTPKLCRWARSPGFLSFGILLVWQAEEAVANLPLRLAVRGHCGHPACAQHDRVHARALKVALRLRVLYSAHRSTRAYRHQRAHTGLSASSAECTAGSSAHAQIP